MSTMMHRLYFRIYLAVLGSLALFALLAGVTWRLVADFERAGPGPAFFQEVAQNLAPPADASPDVQRARLDHWRALSGYELALFTSDGRPIAQAANEALPSPIFDDAAARPGPRPGRANSGRWPGPFGVHAIQLGDGRWLVAARPRGERGLRSRFGWLAALLGLTGAVAVAAYPVVRRLTRGLERLQASVEAFGAGDLTTRAPIVGHDEVARLARKFNQSAARIEDLVRANKTLLGNASHELRSPLARLAMAAESLSSAAPEATRVEIAANIRELDQLIEEILLASRLDGQPADQARFEPVDLAGLAAEECARAGADLEAASGEGASTDSAVVTGDARQLRRLIRNLLENARRHGGGRPIEVVVGRPMAAARPGSTPGNLLPGTLLPRVLLDILDRGPGVPAAERERIFEPFHRPAGVRERDGGVGLGLSLVRQIAARHGGTVVCLARDGGGSCFRVTLPAKTDPEQRPPPQTS